MPPNYYLKISKKERKILEQAYQVYERQRTWKTLRVVLWTSQFIAIIAGSIYIVLIFLTRPSSLGCGGLFIALLLLIVMLCKLVRERQEYLMLINKMGSKLRIK